MSQAPVAVAAVTMSGVEYAGFWRRLAAYLIDGIVLGLVETTLVVGVALMSPNMVPIDRADPVYSTAQDVSNLLGVIGVCWAISWAYFAIFESSPARATVGKLALGIYVGDAHGDPIGFPRASVRFWLKLLSSVPLWGGWLIAAFTPRKQALHDLLAGTLVLRKVHYLVDRSETPQAAGEFWDGARWVTSRVPGETNGWR